MSKTKKGVLKGTKCNSNHRFIPLCGEIMSFLKTLSSVKKLQQGRIANAGSGKEFVRLLDSSTGLKLKVRSKSSYQELFIFCENEDKENVKKELNIWLKEQNIKAL